MKDVENAASFIRAGKLCAFPTETVYGLGADAYNSKAVELIYKIKGRAKKNPLIIHVCSMSQAMELARFDERAQLLAKKFWPGPLSLVLPLKRPSKIAAGALAGLDTAALRMPSHKIALDLIEKSGRPLAAPSANISNHVSATNVQHVIDDFGLNPDIAYIKDVEGNLGLESTIIDASGADLKILRSGSISFDAIERVAGNITTSDPGAKIKSPGMMHRHYSPKTQLLINQSSDRGDSVLVGFGKDDFGGRAHLNLSKDGDLREAARNLYSTLRMADKMAQRSGLKFISTAQIPNILIGIAINDRLHRAASPM